MGCVPIVSIPGFIDNLEKSAISVEWGVHALWLPAHWSK